MIKSNITIAEVKKIILDMQSKKVQVTLNLGRNKYVQFDGRVSGVYSALFTVLPDDKQFRGKTSYSYNEYMCGKVKVAQID